MKAIYRGKNFGDAFKQPFFCFLLVVISIGSLDSLSLTRSFSAEKTFLFTQAELTHNVSYTVAGVSGKVGDVNGYPGTSLLVNPTAVCASPLDYSTNTPQQVIIGSKNSFRTLNPVSWEAGYWFGKPPGVNVPTTGNTTIVSVSNPYGCETVAELNNTFFVQGDANLYVVRNATTVLLYNVKDDLSFVDLAYFNNSVYLISLSQVVFRCTVNDHNVSGCTEISLEGIIENGAGQVGVEASSDGLFVATGAELRRFSFRGESVASIPIPAVALHFMVEREGVLLAATWNAIYTVEWNVSNLLGATLIAGSPTSSSTCSTSTDYNKTVTFCGIYRLYPVSYASIFISTPSLATVRLLSFPDIKIVISLPIPFPDGMVGATDVVSAVYDAMNKAIHDALSLRLPSFPSSELPFVQVNQSNTTIFDGKYNWTTNVSVLIPQVNYVGKDMEKAIMEANFTDAFNLTQQYYSETDFFIFTDSILVDLANASTMFVVSNASAYASRSALHYPLIYSDLPVQSTPSITTDYENYNLFIKLLMPALFSKSAANVTNSTTGLLLSEVSFDKIILDSMKSAYAPSQQGLLSFQESVYHLSQYSPLEQKAIRLRLRDVLSTRFDDCADSHLPNLTNFQTGISNRTLISGGLNNGIAESMYNIFVPDVYTGLDVQKCIDDTDWSNLNDWLNNLNKSSGACNKGCIIAVAVVVAVIIIVLIILIIVFVSKRRRLAVVVAPKAPQKPEFIPTVDLDNLDEHSIYSNPLA